MDGEDEREATPRRAGWRRQPCLDRPAGPIDRQLLDGDGAARALPARTLGRDRPQGAVVDRVDLGAAPVEAGAHRDAAAHCGVREPRPVHDRRRIDQWLGDSRQRHPVGEIAAPVADEHQERLVVEPDRPHRVLGHHEVRPGPVTDRAIERGGEVPRLPAGQVDDPERRLDVAGRVLDIGADERQPPTIGRVRRRLGVARQAHELAHPAAIGPDRPDLRTRRDVGVLALVRGEGDPRAVRCPRRVQDVEVAPRQLPRTRAGADVDGPQVRAANHVAGLVVTEVRPGHAASRRRPVLALVADDEAVIAPLRHERQHAPVRAPVGAAHAAFERGELPGLTAVERQDPHLADRVALAGRGPNEGDTSSVGRELRRDVADPPSRQLACPPTAIGPHVQVRQVVVAVRPAQHVHDRRAVGGEPVRLEGDLGAHERAGSGCCHRCVSMAPRPPRNPRPRADR